MEHGQSARALNGFVSLPSVAVEVAEVGLGQPSPTIVPVAEEVVEELVSFATLILPLLALPKR